MARGFPESHVYTCLDDKQGSNLCPSLSMAETHIKRSAICLNFYEPLPCGLAGKA